MFWAELYAIRVIRKKIKDTRSWDSGTESHSAVDDFFSVTSMLLPYCRYTPVFFISPVSVICQSVWYCISLWGDIIILVCIDNDAFFQVVILLPFYGFPKEIKQRVSVVYHSLTDLLILTCVVNQVFIDRYFLSSNILPLLDIVSTFKRVCNTSIVPFFILFFIFNLAG